MSPPLNLIETKGVRKTNQFILELRQRRESGKLAALGVIFGGVGLGMTTAARAYLLRNASSPQIMITVPPQSTPVELVGQMAFALKEPLIARRSRSKPSDTAIQLINLNQLDLLILDEAERLNGKTVQIIEALRQVVNITIILLVSAQTSALPHTKKPLNDLESFLFPEPSRQDILELVLPGLNIPGWVFNQNNHQDLLLGEQLWEWARPSFRRLRMVIQVASLKNFKAGNRIDRAAIDWAMGYML